MKRLFSYFLPLQLKSYSSKINGELNINLVNGKKTLDTSKSNYSYGSLQKILQLGLSSIGFNNDIKRILVLGLGGGSIVETIRKDFNSNAFIELVDIDSEIINIAKNEFGINKFGNINIVNADASDYLNNFTEAFDLIIVDVFIINQVPTQFTESVFINQLIQHLNSKGIIIYNTMRETMASKVINQIKNLFENAGLNVKIMEKVVLSNDLIIAKKID